MTKWCEQCRVPSGRKCNDFDIPQGATPLDPNEIEGLILTHIQTRAQLDRWEQENINEAMIWAGQKKTKQIFSESFIKRLHKKMFGRVWRWAGRFRQQDKNLGISWYLIPVQIKLLCEDAEYWIAIKPSQPMKSPPVFTIGWYPSILFQTATAAMRDSWPIC